MKLLHAIIACVLLGITAVAAPNGNTPTSEQVTCELVLFLDQGNVDLITS